MKNRTDALSYLSEEVKRDVPALMRGIPEEGLALALAALDKPTNEWTMDEATAVYMFCLWSLGETEGRTIHVIANIAHAALRRTPEIGEEEAVERGVLMVASLTGSASWALREALDRMNTLHPTAFDKDRTVWVETMRTMLEARIAGEARKKQLAGEKRS